MMWQKRSLPSLIRFRRWRMLQAVMRESMSTDDMSVNSITGAGACLGRFLTTLAIFNSCALAQSGVTIANRLVSVTFQPTTGLFEAHSASGSSMRLVEAGPAYEAAV